MSTPTTTLVGGPFHGVEGEIAGTPQTLAFGEAGGFVYRRDETGKAVVYRYAPQLSPAHAGVIEADRLAVKEVAEQEGISTAEVLARAQARKDAKTGIRPAEALLREAERVGVEPLALLESGYDPVTGLYLPEGHQP